MRISNFECSLWNNPDAGDCLWSRVGMLRMHYGALVNLAILNLLYLRSSYVTGIRTLAVRCNATNLATITPWFLIENCVHLVPA